MKKTCTKCGVEKPLEGFYKRKSGRHKFGCSSRCKICIRKSRSDYRKNNRTIINTTNRKSYQKRRSQVRNYRNNYRKKNLEKLKKQSNCNHKKRMQNNIKYVLSRRLRRRIKHALNGHSKSASTQKLTGCSWKYLKQWIESQMTDTMQLDTIHIDHMMPLKSFDLTKPEEQRKACHYTNLQPMLPSENMSKGSRIVYDMKWNGQQWEINRSGAYLPRDKELI